MKSKKFSLAIVALLLCITATSVYAHHRSIFEVLAKTRIPEDSNNHVTVFKKAVEDAGLAKMLNADSPDVDIPALKPPHTVFVPTDDAFAKLTAAQQAELESDLRTIIRSHIILQQSLSPDDLVNQGTIPSMSGTEPITIKRLDDGRVIINDIAVIIDSMKVDRKPGERDDLPEDLGFIHVIDTVLLEQVTPPPPDPNPPPPNPPPSAGVPLARDVEKARFIIKSMGGVLDRSNGGQQVACKEFRGYYRGLLALPTYTDDQLSAGQKAHYALYRQAVDKTIETNRAIDNACIGANGTEKRFINPQNFGVARIGIQDAVAIIGMIPPCPDCPTPPPPPPPPTVTPQQLFDQIEKAEVNMRGLEGVLDQSNEGEKVNCKEYSGYFMGLKAMPEYLEVQLDEHNLKGFYEPYRNAVDIAMQSTESIGISCDGFDGVKFVSPQDFGVARVGLQEGLKRIFSLNEAFLEAFSDVTTSLSPTRSDPSAEPAGFMGNVLAPIQNLMRWMTSFLP